MDLVVAKSNFSNFSQIEDGSEPSSGLLLQLLKSILSWLQSSSKNPGVARFHFFLVFLYLKLKNHTCNLFANVLNLCDTTIKQASTEK